MSCQEILRPSIIVSQRYQIGINSFRNPFFLVWLIGKIWTTISNNEDGFGHDFCKGIVLTSTKYSVFVSLSADRSRL